MSKIRAVVLEKSGSRYTLLDRDGTFRQVHGPLNAEVGEEILISSWIENFRGVRLWSGAVALFLLVITSLVGWNLFQAPTVVALLSVDINPSLQLEIDNQGHFVAFETQNEEAKRLLSQINLKGKPIQEVLEQIVSQAYDQKFLSPDQPWVVVGYSPMTSKTLPQMPKALNKTQIISWITETGEKRGLTPQIAVFSLTSQERDLAQKRDLTLGEYALWQTADKAGVVTQPEKLKDSSERVKLLENSQVQGQIQAEKNEPLIPIKDLYPWLDKSRNEEGDQQNNSSKNQGDSNINTNVPSNAKDNVHTNTDDKAKADDKTKVKPDAKGNDELSRRATDQGNDQTNNLSNAKDSENKATQGLKYNKVYVPQIRGNSHDSSHTYKFPTYDRDKQPRR